MDCFAVFGAMEVSMSITKMHKKAIEIYESLMQSDRKSGSFHKGVFHIHTPASHDYRLFGSDSEGSKWSDYTIDKIYDRCCEIDDVFRISFPTLESTEQLYVKNIYTTQKECLAYICLALRILSLDIDYVVATDHNTITGSQKLQHALNVYPSPKEQKRHVNVIHGVEISCADRVHVVVIYDGNNQQHKNAIEKWLIENRVSEEDGVILTSLDVLRYFIKDVGLIAYIAHINTSRIFNDEFLTRQYKKGLFEQNEFSLIGVNDEKYIENTSRRINNLLPDSEVNYILDNDSHSIDTIDHNYVYILGNYIDYRGLQDALKDYDVCVSFSLPPIPSIRFIGLGIPDSDEGFLHSSPNEKPNSQLFCLGFSPWLNCIIGSRGAGKSTILHMIGLLLGGKNDNQPLIDLLCRHQNIYLFFSVNSEIYCSVFSQPVPSYNESYYQFLRRQIKEEYRVYRGEYFRYERIYEYLNSEFVELYHIADPNDSRWEKIKKKEKKEIQLKAFNSSYSISEIVSLISSDALYKFINTMVLRGLPTSNKYKKPPSFTNNSLKEYLSTIEKWNGNRKRKFSEILDSFNTSTHSTLRLILNDNEDFNEYVELLLPSIDPKSKRQYSSFEITHRSIYQYVLAIVEELGLISFLKAVVNKSPEMFLNIAEPNFDINGHDSITDHQYKKEGQIKLILSIFNLIEAQGKIEDCFIVYTEQTDQFQLEFNVASHNSDNNMKQFRKVTELSMGQKVVAVLSFILLFGQFSGDITPLVIDQPEDNLDSQFIYENLVKDLRKIKTKRQIIIATHNATLVSNCKAEKIVCMQSDNLHGWVEAVGYPAKKIIAQKILQYLEGGKKSFVHRAFVYRDLLK